MFITVVPNPALDKTIVLPGFSTGKIHRVRDIITLAGGKGFNFARALRTLGEQGLIISPAGGYAGKQLQALALQEGLRVEVQEVAAELRTCLTIVDSAADNRLTELYEQGASLTVEEWDALVRRVGAALIGACFMAVCGSFPPGAPGDGLAMLLRQAQAASVPVFLDTHGAHLMGALEYKPALLKINQFEAGELLGGAITDAPQALDAARELQRRGAQAVIISLGKTGVVGCAADGQCFGWASPVVSAVSATGSGDSLLAGIAAGLLRRQGLKDAARLGVAAGAANTLLLGAGCLNLSDVERLLPAVQAMRITA